MISMDYDPVLEEWVLLLRSPEVGRDKFIYLDITVVIDFWRDVVCSRKHVV